jgi:hypothetical protein
MLKNAEGGKSPDWPQYVQVSINLGDLSQPDNDYIRLLAVIGKVGKYVHLALSGCTM